AARWILTTEPKRLEVRSPIRGFYSSTPETHAPSHVYHTVDALLNSPDIAQNAFLVIPEVSFDGVLMPLVIENFQRSPRAIIRLSQSLPAPSNEEE
ncbi:MAG TPA: hypothetical protein PK109_03780, partial [Candidatus Paceibacterota bacterium]|nr:hypothetical protein [Candidatus Paceibacterota bacterium]